MEVCPSEVFYAKSCMASTLPIPITPPSPHSLPEATSASHGKGEFEAMARRRFQNPKLQLRGDWWTIRVWQDEVENGVVRRSYKRIRLAPATMRERGKLEKSWLNTCNR